MLASDRERFKEELCELADKHGRERSALVPILQEVQHRHREISPFAMQIIADQLGIHPVEVYGVVSFYMFLDDKPKGRFVIRLCRTISCELEGRDQIARQLETDLRIEFGQTTPDGMFTLEWANCMGMCDQGPALLVNERICTGVTPDMVDDILEECRATLGLHATHPQEEHLV